MIKREKTFIIIFLFLTILVYFSVQIFLYSRGFFALSADEAGHTLEAYSWYKGESGFYSIWLPFQKILYGLSFHINENLFWMPRIISSVFGLLTLISLMYLSYELFEINVVSLITGLIGVIFWGIAIFSVLPMTEIYFFFFTVTSIALLIKWWKKKSFFVLVMALLSMEIASTIRYEAWVFILIIFAIVIIDFIKSDQSLSSKLVKLLLVILCLFSFPVIWVFFSFKVTGQILGFIQSVTGRYIPDNTFLEIQKNVIFNFLYVNVITLNILGLFTYFIIRNKYEIKLYLFLLISTLIIYGVFTFFSKAMPTHNSWRIATLWSILLFPLTVYFCYFFYLTKQKYLKYVSILTSIIFIFLLINKLNNFSQFSYMNREDIIVGDYINDHLLVNNEHSKIFIQDNSWEYSNLLITSQHPLNFITEKKLSQNISIKTAPFYEEKKWLLKDWNVKYIILKPLNEDFFDMNKLIPLKRYNRWIIYKLE